MKTPLAVLLFMSAAVSSPASAQLKNFRIINVPIDAQEAINPSITGVLFTRVLTDDQFETPTFVPAVMPGHETTFEFVVDEPCQYLVKVHQLNGPDLSSTTSMNVCTQRTIYVKGGIGNGTLLPVTFWP